MSEGREGERKRKTRGGKAEKEKKKVPPSSQNYREASEERL